MSQEAPASTGATGLSPHEFAAWGGLLAVHKQLVRRLDADLRRGHGLSLPSYDALLHLARAPQQRLRMTDMAEALHFTRGGVSKLVDKLEGRGLVVRRVDPDDRRALLAEMTDLGRQQLDDARATHLDGVRRLFLDRLEDADIETLGSVWLRLRHEP